MPTSDPVNMGNVATAGNPSVWRSVLVKIGKELVTDVNVLVSPGVLLNNAEPSVNDRLSWCARTGPSSDSAFTLLLLASFNTSAGCSSATNRLSDGCAAL